MAPWLRTYGSYQGRECSTRPCHGSGYAHSALEHNQLTWRRDWNVRNAIIEALVLRNPRTLSDPPWVGPGGVLCYNLLWSSYLFILFGLATTDFCMLLVHDTCAGYLWIQVMYKGSRTDVKGKYPSVDGNPIHTALEQVRNLSSPYIKIPRCHHFVALVYVYRNYSSGIPVTRNTAAGISRVT